MVKWSISHACSMEQHPLPKVHLPTVLAWHGHGNAEVSRQRRSIMQIAEFLIKNLNPGMHSCKPCGCADRSLWDDLNYLHLGTANSPTLTRSHNNGETMTYPFTSLACSMYSFFKVAVALPWISRSVTSGQLDSSQLHLIRRSDRQGNA